jgi:large subunit ribosomal protein L23
MAIFNIFKKNKPAAIKPEEKKEPVKKVKAVKKPSVAEKPATKPAPVKAAAKGKNFNETWKILAKPHITEKATDLAEKNQYVFKVFPGAGKSEIKKAVESLYGVTVLRVGIVNISRKKIRVGRTMGFKGGYKKAIVRIKEGQKIEVL